jgi:DHA1 family multidrug resistance protein-like MFS transporter
MPPIEGRCKSRPLLHPTRAVRYRRGMTSPRAPQDWRIPLGVFWVTQLVETIGVSQVFALLPTALREMGVPEADRLAFVGLYSSLMFVLGLPLVPLWGVWADKISRKAVIIRSAVVEAVVFGLAALAREPWQLAVAVMLIGLQLGNTGVMLAAIRDATPRARLGTAIALFGAAGPIGLAAGPALAGLLIDQAGWTVSGVFALSSVLSVGTALLVALGTREIRPEIVPSGSVLRLAFGAVVGILRDPTVRRLFIVYGVAFLANQISRPYTPLLVEELVGTGPGLASGIGLVMGVAALVGALASPVGGWIGDRAGFRPVLLAALAAGGVASLLMPAMPTLGLLAAAAVVLGAAFATTGAMVFSLLATEVPPERRSATLNLVYLPLYIAGIIGPAIGGALAAAAGPGSPFIAGGAVFLAGALVIALVGRREAPAKAPVAATEPPRGSS